MLQHAATRCNTLQHAATRCNTLQHAATRCSFFAGVLIGFRRFGLRRCHRTQPFEVTCVGLPGRAGRASQTGECLGSKAMLGGEYST